MLLTPRARYLQAPKLLAAARTFGAATAVVAPHGAGLAREKVDDLTVVDFDVLQSEAEVDALHLWLE